MGALDELLAQTGGGGKPQSLAELLAATGGAPEPQQQQQQPRPANDYEANGPGMPAGGKVTELPPQNIQGDPHAGESVLDGILRSAGELERGRSANDAIDLNAKANLGENMANGASWGTVGTPQGTPVQQGVGRFIGAMASPVNALAVPARGAGLVAAGLRNGAVGAAQGAVQRAAGDPNATPGDIARSAAAGGVVGGLGGAGMQSISRGLGGAAQGAGAAADEYLLRSTGIPEAEAVRMGPQDVAARAQKIRDAGLKTSVFQSPRGYAQNAQGLMKQGGDQMGTAEDAINALPNAPNVPVGDIIAKQRAAAAAQGGLADPANAGPAGFRQQFANNLENDTTRMAGRNFQSDAERFSALSKGYQATAYSSNELPFDRALAQRRNVDGWTNFGATNATESAQNAVRKEIGGGLRDNIDASLNSPSVPPELAGNWRAGRDAYSLGSDVNESALKAIGDSGIPASKEQAMGFMARRGGLSAASSAAGAAQSALGAGGDAASSAQGLALQRWLGDKGVQMQPQQQQPPKAAGENSQGGSSGYRAAQLIEQNPQALGKYAPQFQQAQQNGGVEAVNALINKLTFSDSEFRNGPGALLQQGGPNGS